MTEFKREIDINHIDTIDLSQLFGRLDENIKFLEDKFQVRIKLKEGYLLISGPSEENISKVEKHLKSLFKVLKQQKSLSLRDVKYLVYQGEKNPEVDLSKHFKEAIIYSSTGKVIRPKTLGQKRYIDAIKTNNVTFGVGPAGTGKTYLAVAMAVKAFKEKEVARIILTRPAVEAGENLGFLPGDLQMKVDPYLRPLYDAIFDMLGADVFYDLLEKNIIEVAPLAYMRGRTLDNSYIILDEAQNTTSEQMKMFLTRLGQGSKAIVNGDITQIDLKRGQKSGLLEVIDILHDIDKVSFIFLDKSDIVRHSVVQKIIEAYEEAEEKKKALEKKLES
ncbi:PhoH family protein [Neofamilia massiliensis]|uniref:PhoH family protein n=1 Tax=Neofamilia massiliensis TaxID=1673724 RepID=UPI0006BB5C7B|nr:PhoH family protein [Neofamilia massiliensis]